MCAVFDVTRCQVGHIGKFSVFSSPLHLLSFTPFTVYSKYTICWRNMYFRSRNLLENMVIFQRETAYRFKPSTQGRERSQPASTPCSGGLLVNVLSVCTDSAGSSNATRGFRLQWLLGRNDRDLCSLSPHPHTLSA